MCLVNWCARPNLWRPLWIDKGGGSLSNIHPTAIVDPKAQIADHVTIGPYSIIQSDIEIGKGTQIHSHVLVSHDGFSG